MDPLKERLLRLGQTVADASDRSADPRTLATARQRLRQTLSRPPRSHGAALTLGVGLALAAAVGIGSYALWAQSRQAPLTFNVEAREESTARAVQTGELETKQLHFSDGTTVALQPSSEIEVRSLTSTGATVGLTSGRARASVERTQDAAWRFLAGPFLVQVTGTEFDLAWDPKSRVFELALHEGSVELTGPGVKGTRRVGQGEYVRLAAAADEGGGESADRRTPAGDAPGAGADKAATESKAAGPERKADAPPKGAGWAELIRAGERQAAFRALDKAGPAALAQASTQDLWDLASAARLGGRPELARDALLTLRKGHGARGQTAFLLGKVAADQLAAKSEAIKWFQTYLAEDPSGPLAEQALGRLIELQAGTRAGRTFAKEYLARYPQGSYASFARSLLR